jgi:hypothetical protein
VDDEEAELRSVELLGGRSESFDGRVEGGHLDDESVRGKGGERVCGLEREWCGVESAVACSVRREERSEVEKKEEERETDDEKEWNEDEKREMRHFHCTLHKLKREM